MSTGFTPWPTAHTVTHDDHDDYHRRVLAGALGGRLDELTAAGAETAGAVDQLAANHRRVHTFAQALAAGMSPERARTLLGLPDRAEPADPEPVVIPQDNGIPLVVYPGEHVGAGILHQR
ncbi:hypothetical protein M1843_04920 [Isoptericola sp. 4D.3]|uniref:Uncharacterized protein n=1 Tax=Isoptericola peretonis TaxID=2918523 RepID=A0ABT0J0R2_9MICO|nr:hypothetical protein [Isoptericola sp. 4D.3]